MTKLTKETKEKAEKLGIRWFLKNKDFIFDLSGTAFTIGELKQFISQFKDEERILFDYECSNDYDYESGDSNSANLDYANLLVRQTEELSEEEILKEIKKIELKKSKNKEAAKKRKETEKINKEKKIKQLELELEKLKGTNK